MAYDPIDALLRLRRLAVDQVRRELAGCVQRETEAMAALAAIEATIEREVATAGAPDAGDAAVEAFGAWFKRIRPVQEATADAVAQAQLRTKEARIVLAAGQAALRAVQETVARHAAERHVVAARREQHALEEVARSYAPLPQRLLGGPMRADISGANVPPCPTRPRPIRSPRSSSAMR